jgi:hypothetical protein
MTQRSAARSRRGESALVDAYIRELARRQVRRPISTGPQSGHFYMPESTDPIA